MHHELMDYLRDSIVTLFADTNVEGVLQKWCKKDFSCINKLDESMLTRDLYKKNLRSTTMDQMNVVAKTIITLWMTDNSQALGVRFSSSSTIFNTLLYFTSEVLSMDGTRQVRCKFNDLLRWHELTYELGEDLLTLSYMAASDLYDSVKKRPSFDWQPILPIEKDDLQTLMEKTPMADIHNHLYGSSLNFDLNWLSLMNYADKLDWQHILKNTHMADQQERIQSLVYSAACIRLYLWSLYNVSGVHIDSKKLSNVFKGQILSKKEAVKSILGSLGVARLSSYPFHAYDENGKINLAITPTFVDYAIVPNCVKSHNRTSPNFIFSILSGERYLMYSIYRDIYNHTEGVESIETLFYAYLLIKNQLRKELVQLNNGLGFGNFDEYERCKKVFLYKKSIFPSLLEQVAISSTIAQYPNLRYMETRIAPKNDSSISDQINRIEKNIHNFAFVDPINARDWKYDFLYHFIKTKPSDVEIRSFLQCRNYACRQEVKLVALKIADYAQKQQPGPKKVVGIDAANSEMNCRPEVFAQAFRYLRRISVNEYDKQLKTTKTYSLGITYHVGEDNYDVVDGLRAIDEMIRFLEYKPGNRVGHGLVLGVDVKKYYVKRHYTLLMPRIVLLDNVVWMLHQLDKYRCGTSALKLFLKEQYDEMFRIIYPEKEPPLQTTYYASWLLRGDNPELYKITMLPLKICRSVSVWDQYALTKGFKYLCARCNLTARRLNREYHYNGKAKERGSVSAVIKIPNDLREDWVNSIRCIQEKFLSNIEDKYIFIECNPSSNRKIGDFDRYDEHPAMIFNNIDKTRRIKHFINISFNTDDKGVIVTSLEREYALMALALKKGARKTPWSQIIQWLERICHYGAQNAFHFPFE